MYIAYCPELSIDNSQISLSKPKHVFDAIFKHGDVVLKIKPFDASDFYLCHSEKYVDGVFSGNIVNGFGTTDPLYLKQIRYTTAALREAALTAFIRTDCRNVGIIPALVSGFHHAHYDYGRGYCTFNGLVWTAMMMKQLRHLNKVAIIDLDGHCGDGTEQIINRLCLWDWLHNYIHFKNIPRNSNKLINFLKNFPYQNYDLILYQAGADAHKDDPYNVGYMDDKTWAEKDEIIFFNCANKNIPLAFNLAGGYNNQKTIDLHTQTIQIARQYSE